LQQIYLAFKKRKRNEKKKKKKKEIKKNPIFEKSYPLTKKKNVSIFWS